MALEKELAAFANKLPELKGSEGKFALVHGDDFVDVFGTYEDALRDGYRRFGLESFLVRQIRSRAGIQFVTRIAVPASSSHTDG